MNCKKLLSVSIGVLTLTTMSCKPSTPDSSLQTLDNFAAGKRVTTNACIGPAAVLKSPTISAMNEEIESKRIIWDTAATRDPLSLALRKAFSAVPPAMQTQFLATQGRFVVSKNANKLCTDRKSEFLKDAKQNAAELAALREGLKSVEACYLYAMPEEASLILSKKTDKPVFFVVLSDDRIQIQHNLVRVFGYMNSQISSLMLVEGDFTDESNHYRFSDKQNPEFASDRSKVTDAFLQDLKKLGKYESFKQFESAVASKAERQYFEDFVYAEAFDSFFCNEDTLKTMGKDFDLTLRAFIPTLGQKSSLALTSPTPKGFGLWGNPFTWVGNQWSGYTQQRDAIIQKLTEDTMSVNGGKPPSMLQTVSIAANGAWRPVTNAPLLSTYVRPAVNAADAIGGATIQIDANGNAVTHALTAQERLARGGAAVADVAVGQAAKALSANIGTAGGDSAEALVKGATNLAPGLGREVVQGVAYHGTNAAVKFVPGVVANKVGGALSDAAQSTGPAPAPGPAAPAPSAGSGSAPLPVDL